MPRMPFRLPAAEFAAILAVLAAFSGAQLIAHHDDVVGDPIPINEMELVAVRGVGAVLRDRDGRQVAIWEQPTIDQQSLIEFTRGVRGRLNLGLQSNDPSSQ